MYLVDTSIWIHALRPRGHPSIRERLTPLLTTGQTALTDWIVLELMTGVRARDEEDMLRTFLSPLPTLSIDEGCWKTAFELAVGSRRHGVTPSAADCLIAAASIQHTAPLIHMDGDFEAIARHNPQLKQINWAPA